MNSPFKRPLLRLRTILSGFDLPLLAVVLMLASLGLVTMYSVGYDHGSRFVDHGRNMLLAATLMFLIAQVPPHRLLSLAVPLYTVGVALLVATSPKRAPPAGSTSGW